MANLQRPARDDPFQPSTVPVRSATIVPRRTTASVSSSALKIPFPVGLHRTASPPPRQQQVELAPPTPSTPPSLDFGRRRCGGVVPRVRVCCFGDPEMKRRRRVTGYKAYAMEGKVKATIRRGLRWFKRKCVGILRF